MSRPDALYDAARLSEGKGDDLGTRSVRGGSWHEDKWVARSPGRGRTDPRSATAIWAFAP